MVARITKHIGNHRLLQFGIVAVGLACIGDGIDDTRHVIAHSSKLPVGIILIALPRDAVRVDKYARPWLR